MNRHDTCDTSADTEVNEPHDQGGDDTCSRVDLEQGPGSAEDIAQVERSRRDRALKFARPVEDLATGRDCPNRRETTAADRHAEGTAARRGRWRRRTAGVGRASGIVIDRAALGALRLLARGVVGGTQQFVALRATESMAIASSFGFCESMPADYLKNEIDSGYFHASPLFALIAADDREDDRKDAQDHRNGIPTNIKNKEEAQNAVHRTD